MTQQTIGQRLSDAREGIRASLYQASRDTKIRVDFLQAMEEDEFNFVSGSLYVRGMLRSYIRWLGIEEGVLLQEFDVVHDSKPEPSLARLMAKPSPHIPKARRPSWMIAGVLASSVLLILSLIGVMGRSGDVASPAAAPPETESGSAGTSNEPAVPPPVAQAEAPPPVDGVHVTVNVVGDRSWVEAHADTNQPLYKGTMEPGAVRTFDGTGQVHLVIGNLGGVQISVNGRNLGVAGQPGKVGSLTFTPQSTNLAGG
jgi:cytoskeletal protein RodZ